MTPTEIVLLVAEHLDALGVPYVLVGSLASSARGVPRSTNDADIVAQLEREHISSLLERLSSDFYVEQGSVERAVAQGRSFNAIHLDTGFKIDMFVPPPGGFGRQQLARGVHEIAVSGAQNRGLRIATAEDVLLAKLLSFRAGGSVSDRQWQDALGLIRVQQAALDRSYLRAWAARLDIAELLERALTEGLT